MTLARFISDRLVGPSKLPALGVTPARSMCPQRRAQLRCGAVVLTMAAMLVGACASQPIGARARPKKSSKRHRHSLGGASRSLSCYLTISALAGVVSFSACADARNGQVQSWHTYGCQMTSRPLGQERKPFAPKDIESASSLFQVTADCPDKLSAVVVAVLEMKDREIELGHRAVLACGTLVPTTDGVAKTFPKTMTANLTQDEKCDLTGLTKFILIRRFLSRDNAMLAESIIALKPYEDFAIETAQSYANAYSGTVKSGLLFARLDDKSLVQNGAREADLICLYNKRGFSDPSSDVIVYSSSATALKQCIAEHFDEEPSRWNR